MISTPEPSSAQSMPVHRPASPHGLAASTPASQPAPPARAESTLLFTPASFFEPVRWRDVFGNVNPVEIELGAGDGSFLIRQAAADPARNFLGVERFLGRIRKIDRKGRRAGLNNLRLFRIEAAYFLEFLVPRGSVAALHIYFPDPWPKRRHHKHRLINQTFPDIAARAVQPDGRLYLRTDNIPYFNQFLEVFAASNAWKQIPTPDSLAANFTDFERDFHARRIPTLHTAYMRIPE